MNPSICCKPAFIFCLAFLADMSTSRGTVTGTMYILISMVKGKFEISNSGVYGKLSLRCAFIGEVA